MAKILITGGAGFIGSHIVDTLLEHGHEVHVLDNLSSGSLDNVCLSARFHKGDIRDESISQVLLTVSPDVVIHCAAQISVRTSMEDPKLDAEVNVVGLINILQSFPPNKLPFFVFISTGGAIYGEQETFPADENHDIKPSSVYGLAKRVGELYLDLWSREFGLKYTSLRLSNVYGPRQNPHGEAGVVAIFSEKLISDTAPVINGSGEQTRDFVFVRDVANAVNSVVSIYPQGIFNIGTGKETSVNELYNHIASSLDSDIKSKPAEGKKGEQMRSCIDYSLAFKTFNWEPKVKLQEGIKATTEWFKDHKKK